MLEYEPGLVEEAVLRAVRGHPRERGFRRERDRLYEIKDPEGREAAFRQLHADWFERLELGEPIALALREQPAIGAGTRGCRIALARSRQEEAAELFVRAGGGGPPDSDRRWVVVRLRPEALIAGEALLQFLRHELFHIADMLDPGFGYEPQLPASGIGPAHERLLRDRYRALWDATIDGRLARLGRAPASARADRMRDFLRAFPMLGEGTEASFLRFFHGLACTHDDLLAFATNPVGVARSCAPGPRPATEPAGKLPAPGPTPGERCPLCRFPTHAFEPDPLGLPAGTVGAIRGDFPHWEPAHGLCLQCADLYRVRGGGERAPGYAEAAAQGGRP
jgi:hypothetical protein